MKIRRTHRFWALLLTLAMLVSLVSSVFAAETAATMQLTRTEGTVNVTNAGGREVTVREKMRLYSGYAVKTEEKSYAWIALDDTKLAKVDAASEVEIRRNGKSLEILLNAGSVFFNVTEPLEEDETLNICTSSMIAGIRGTTGWVSLKNSKSGLGVLEGRVLCTTVENSVWVEPGQLTSFDNSGGMMSEKIDLDETPGYVLVEVVTDPELCAEIEAASGLEVTSVTLEQAEAKLEADEAQTAVEMEKPPEPVPVSDNSGSDSSTSDSSSSDDSGSGDVVSESPSVPETPVDIITTAGDFIVKGGKEGEAFKYEAPVLTILTNRAITIWNREQKPTDNRIEVSRDARGANVTLAGVNIDTSANRKTAAFLIPDNYEKNVTIFLANGSKNVLISGEGCAGLQKNGDNSGLLTIKGEDGSLMATGGGQGAGIGGGYEGSASHITIEGGTVTATGGGSSYGGAGIGGGYEGSGNDITIEGGTVEATGGDYGGAGIGSGGGNDYGSNGTGITISGGKVTAIGGEYSAGIGGGVVGKGTGITITGGTVTAAGGNQGAGIGSGMYGDSENITITGGTVEATGGNYGGAGIGSGKGGDACHITIEGGTVEATGGDYGGAGIGGGDNGLGKDIVITGGTVRASWITTVATIINGNTLVYIETGTAAPSVTPGSGLYVQKGIIFYPDPNTDGKAIGLVVGEVTLKASASIPDCKKLTISENSTLTIPNGITLTLGAGATLVNSERITGNGQIVDSDKNQLYSATAPAMMSLLPEDPEPPTEPAEPEDGYTLSSDTEPATAAAMGTYLAGPSPEVPEPASGLEVYAVSPDTTVYEDVPSNAWYAGAVRYCQENGLMSGTDAARFTPNGALTRSMTASWDEGAGIGYPGDTPDQTVTREELAVLLWQKAGSPESGSALPFADADLLSENAVQAAAWANETGLMTGKPNALLDPLAAVTRAEAATILMRRDLAAAAPALAVGNSVTDASLGANGITAADDGSLLVTDVYNRKIWRVNEGRASVYAGGDTVKDVYDRPQGGYLDAGLLESHFGEPWAIAPWGGGWAVSDAANDALRLLSGEKVETISREFSHPTGLAADDAGNLYISDTFNGTIRKLDANGKLSVAASGLNDPMGLCWKNGVLYIAETGANRISRLDGAALSVVAGSGENDNLDGAAGKAAFSSPKAVVVADDGSVYVSDSGNSSIRRIQNGWVSTVAARDYSAGDLRLIDPSGLLLRGDSLLVCDTFARTVLEFPLD